MVNDATQWIIRHAVAADADGLTVCMTQAYQPYLARMGGQLLPPMMVDYAQEIQESEVWVAVDESDVLGAVILSESEHGFHIANIAVHPQA